MKKTFHLLILLGLIQCAPKKAIVNLKNSNIKSIIENEKLNIVYRGIRNPLTIYMPNVDSIKVSGIGVLKTEENKYYIAPGKGIKVGITVIGYKNGQEIIDKREFRILNIQAPHTSINKKIRNITLSTHKLANATIKTHIPQFVWKLPEVQSFRYQINKQEPIINIGNSFDEFARERIYRLKKGDSVIVDYIKILTDRSNTDRKRIRELKIYIE